MLNPYFALDIETTGLNIERSQVLEVALVYDDGHSPINSLPTLNLIIKPETLYYEPFAMAMHSSLLRQIHQGHTVPSATLLIKEFLQKYAPLEKYTIAGKNVAGFDLPILRNNNINLDRVNHRIIDVGSIYFADFGYVPSLQEIKNFIGDNSYVAHTALEDAFDVVWAIRHKFKTDKNEGTL